MLHAFDWSDLWGQQQQRQPQLLLLLCLAAARASAGNWQASEGIACCALSAYGRHDHACAAGSVA